VVWNLLKNAAKFTPRGGLVAVRSRNVREGADDHEVWALDVADSGLGIAPMFLSQIFEPFAQEESSDGPRRGGLGLGLAISRALVAAQGGTLSAKSPGQGLGSTFTVTLPVAETPVPMPPFPSEGLAPTQSQDRIRVLLVEDDSDTRWMLSRLIRKWGHEVRDAGDLQTALELADEGAFDVLLSDLSLPDGTGHDLLRALESRALGPFAAIALTGHGRDDDLRRSHDFGFVEHLTKPVDAHLLHETIRQVVEAMVKG
jgi:CheY-like chemotaxis protein